MDYKELFKKYQSLLIENNNLRDEIKSLRNQLGIKESQADCDVILNQEALVESINQSQLEYEPVDETFHTEINNMSEPHEKIKLLMSIFKGREVCEEFSIPLAVERSRSGNGAHA